MRYPKQGETSWVDAETELLLGTLAKLEGYTVTGSAENGFLFEVVLDKVEAGQYTITEANSAIPGFEKVSTTVESGSETLAAGGAIRIDLEDDYEKITTGKLTFAKTVTGGVTQEEAEGALTFTIQNETTGKYLSVSEAGAISWVDTETELLLGTLAKLDGYTVTGDVDEGFLFKVVLEDLEIGTYTITEKNSSIDGFETQDDIRAFGKQGIRSGSGDPDQPERYLRGDHDRQADVHEDRDGRRDEGRGGRRPYLHDPERNDRKVPRSIRSGRDQLGRCGDRALP